MAPLSVAPKPDGFVRPMPNVEKHWNITNYIANQCFEAENVPKDVKIVGIFCIDKKKLKN